MRLFCVNMQHIYVDMQHNVCQYARLLCYYATLNILHVNIIMLFDDINKTLYRYWLVCKWVNISRVRFETPNKKEQIKVKSLVNIIMLHVCIIYLACNWQKSATVKILNVLTFKSKMKSWVLTDKTCKGWLSRSHLENMIDWLIG